MQSFWAPIQSLVYRHRSLDPVTVSIPEITKAVGLGDGVQMNWTNLAALRGQFVRIINAEIVERNVSNPDRPDFYLSRDGGQTVVNFYDIGLHFRNDRRFTYPPPFNVLDSNFVPPPLQSLVNIQGFLALFSGADQLGRSSPENALMSIVPFERRGCETPNTEFGCDFELAAFPPIVSELSPLTEIPNDAEPVSLTFTVQVDSTETLDVAFCEFYTSQDETTQTVEAILTGS